jgi:hypothetical protein
MLLPVAKARVLDTHFLNVELDMYSKCDLRPLVDQLGRKVIVLFSGREKRKFSAHLEIAGHARTADATIRAFCRLIENLPVAERKMWDAASIRSFSIGIQAEIGSPVRDFRIARETLAVASNLGAEIVFTVYAPTPQPHRSAGTFVRFDSLTEQIISR